MIKRIYYLVIILCCCTGVAFRFMHNHEAMPIGCDETGYLNQAKAMDAGTTFGSHVQRPYLDGLLRTLRDSGIADAGFAWMVTPHAYHLLPSSNQVINQYPPGTASVLCLIPHAIRKIAFPVVAVLILFLFVVVGLGKIASTEWNLADLVLPLFVFLATVSAPFTTELARVNSLAFTFGPLLLAGMLLRRYPYWACFLIALTANFRIANILMVAPVLLFLPLQNFSFPGATVKNNRLLLRFGLIVLFAVIPLFWYTWKLTGSPFTTTYSAIDTATSGKGSIFGHLSYYFNPGQYWLRVHVIALFLLGVALWVRAIDVSTFLKSLSFPVVNYFFFLFHGVVIDYYPYASAIILTGIIMGICATKKIKEKSVYVLVVAGILASVVVLVSGVRRFRKKESLSYAEAVHRYAGLCQYQVVWSDLYSGTSEYVCGNSGFRFAAGSKRGRRIALKYLHQNHYSQALVLSDIPLPASSILDEINKAGLEYGTVQDTDLGTLVYIKE